MIDFLKERSRVLQKLVCHSITNQPQQAVKAKQPKVFVQTNKEVCSCCSSSHSIYKCMDFKRLTVSEHFDKVKKSGLCFNCLRIGHRTLDCKTDQQCKSCGKRHHSLLHQHTERSDDNNKQAESNRPKSPARSIQGETTEEEVAQQRTVSCCTQNQAVTKQIFLSTAKVLVHGSGNFTATCRALLDCCSESNVITEVEYNAVVSETADNDLWT